MLKKIRTLAKNWVDGRENKIPKIKNLRTITMCDNCYAFYYKNSWHIKRPAYLVEYGEEETPVLFTKCGACLGQEDALYERELGFDFGTEQQFG